ncbi:large subunit ribosomal protein L28, partial [Lecanoromycetidae sp. Uapishka_2]
MTPIKPPSLNLLRSLSTTSRSHASMAQLTRHRCPPYPYGPALHYKQSNSGLYGGSSIQFGNKISEKNESKSRRAWRPNIHNKRLWSDALGKFLAVRVQARVLRTIDKVGGLDEYLLGEKPQRIKELGMEGWRLRWKVMRSKAVRERFLEERKRLGLPEGGYLVQKAVARKVVQKIDGVEEEVERVSGEVVDQIHATDEAEASTAEAKDTENPTQRQPIEPVDRINETIVERVERTAREIEARRPRSKVTQTEASPSTEVVTKATKPPGTRWSKAEKRAHRQQLEESKIPGGDDQEIESAPPKLLKLRIRSAGLGKVTEPSLDRDDSKGSKGSKESAFERLKGWLQR